MANALIGLIVVAACGGTSPAPAPVRVPEPGASRVSRVPEVAAPSVAPSQATSPTRPAPKTPAAAIPTPPSTAAIVQVAPLGSQTCALHADGTVSCWGTDAHGDLHLAPVQVHSDPSAIQLVGHGVATCALRRDGTRACWSPQRDLPGPPAVQLAGSCSRTRDGAIACLGPSDRIDTVEGIADAVDLATWGGRGCAVTQAGRVACWQADPAVGTRLVATAVKGVDRAVQVAVGQGFACARLGNGDVTCWGANNHGELGRGKAPPEKRRGLPVTPPPPPVLHDPAPILGVHDAVSIAAAEWYACALRRDATVACWGTQQHLITDANVARPLLRPTKVAGLAGVKQISVGNRHACALRDGRDVACWGENTHGQLGDGWSGERMVPTDVPGISDAVDLGWGCALRRNGRIACWGVEGAMHRYHGPRDRKGVDGIVGGADVGSGDLEVLLDREGRVWASIKGRRERMTMPPAAQVSSRCAVTRAGRLWCWTSRDRRPREVDGISDVVTVAAGDHHACALRTDGEIVCWFGNDSDGLDLANPRTVPVVTDAKQLVVSWSGRDCAIRSDASVWCWQWDLDRYVSGGPVEAPPASPRDFTAMRISDATSLSVSLTSVCAVRRDGTVVCARDQSFLDPVRPVPVPGIVDATRVLTHQDTTCVVRAAGTVACWGKTGDGEVGTVGTSYVPDPREVVWP